MWIIYGVWKLSPVSPVLLRVCRSQELSPASDDRKRAGPRMGTLAAGGWRLGATRPEEVRILELE